MKMSEIQEYKIQRIRKGIKVIQIAKVLKCSPTLISRFENHGVLMTFERMKKYREFIENYCI
ncbi:XRE family transcriptional regulator [Schinkia azotoformans]|uniref:XRE family transcriptional regulator n=1 Tax=Schinkia azotoformans TaxID=1454 RepID=UPI002DBA1C67|nr:XRE family transcriptional regulator [Schinkia azotoformans]MEC1697742.1 XRE family transcriptional regulator [Schinkia azotoformans]